jgi:hypothetical protein
VAASGGPHIADSVDSATSAAASGHAPIDHGPQPAASVTAPLSPEELLPYNDFDPVRSRWWVERWRKMLGVEGGGDENWTSSTFPDPFAAWTWVLTEADRTSGEFLVANNLYTGVLNVYTSRSGPKRELFYRIASLITKPD